MGIIIIVSAVISLLSAVTLFLARKKQGYADFYFLPAGSFYVCKTQHVIMLKPVRKVAKSILIVSSLVCVYFAMMLGFVSIVGM